MRAKLTSIAVALGLATLVPAAPAVSESPNYREFRPAACTGTVVEGAQRGRFECVKVNVNAFNDGSTRIIFTAYQMREGRREWFLLHAAIRAGDVAGATQSPAPIAFPITAFYIHRAIPEQPPNTGPARWPLQGICTVSIAAIECGTNDAVGGFAMRAYF